MIFALIRMKEKKQTMKTQNCKQFELDNQICAEFIKCIYETNTKE
jgi:hypothetical protein